MGMRVKEHQEVVIDIDGPDGNAFALMGYAKDFGRQLGYNARDCGNVIAEMTSGDYENLLKTFTKHFPFVVLETSDKELVENINA